tara:strand:+ start:868 stop:1044 length:177 start_codon:yes stop_codon:yes gene_type:complete
MSFLKLQFEQVDILLDILETDEESHLEIIEDYGHVDPKAFLSELKETLKGQLYHNEQG